MEKFKNSQNFQSLAGKILIANPYCSFGDIFYKSILYIVAHSEYGSIGLIINKYANKLGLKKLYKISNKYINEQEKPILIGGPVEPERSFILHSSDYIKNIVFEKKGPLVVSSNVEIIKDILEGKGPSNSLVILGYTGWEAGQLEQEIKNNYWLIANADESLIFEDNQQMKWNNALSRIGIENQLLSPQMGMC